MRMRHKEPARLACILGFMLIALLVSACGSENAVPAATPTVAPVAAATGVPMVTAQPEATGTPAEEGGGPPSEPDVAGVSTAVAERTAVPTPTPGPLQIKVDQSQRTWDWPASRFSV